MEFIDGVEVGALLCSAAGYLHYLYGLLRLDPATVSPSINHMPVPGALSGRPTCKTRAVSS